MKIEDYICVEDVIVEKPRKNEDDEEIPPETGEGIIEKSHH